MNQRSNPRKRGTGSNLVDVGRDAVRADLIEGKATSKPGNVDRTGGHGESLRRRRGDAAGEELGTDPVDRDMVNVGTSRGCPPCRPVRTSGGQVRCRLLTASGDGACVVVGGRESRPQGEGRQRDRSRRAGRPGGRR